MKNIIYTNGLKDENIFLKKFISKNINNEYDVVEELSSSSYLKKLHKKGDRYFKSLYCIDSKYKNYNDCTWIMPGKLIGYQKPKKKNYFNRKKCQIFTPARSGTVFLEVLLKNYYEKVIKHFTLNSKCDFAKHSEDIIFLNEKIKRDKTADIFFIYRTDLLAYFTSMIISLTVGFHHESAYDYSNVKILKKNYNKHIYQISKALISYFNTTCNMILSNQSTKFYLVNFENMIKNYSHVIKHTPVNYARKKMELFEDYEIFKQKCLSAIEILEFYKKNWLDKLDQLQVPYVCKFDNFDKISK
jgi:hypothetical protein